LLQPARSPRRGGKRDKVKTEFAEFLPGVQPLKNPAFAFSFAVLWMSLSISGEAQTRHLSADDMPKVVRLVDPQISPDGKTIAITVGRANLKEDRYDTEIDFVDVATRQLRVMTHDRLGIASVRWSPNGDRIAYLAQDAN
jgi:hypothetical protein